MTIVMPVFRSIFLSFYLLYPFAVLATEFKPAILFDSELVMDKSFNEALYNGMELFKRKTGISYEAQARSQDHEQTLQALVDAGHNPILVPGNANKDIVAKLSAKNPKTFFITVDYVLAQPNVYSILFKEHEGTFLAGVLAGLATKTNKIGFIGGMDIPPIQRFAFGFAQGIKYVNPKAELLIDFVKDATDPWNSPDKGKEIAQAQLKKGVDIIFPAAGGTGMGALAAAAQAKKLGIGVDSNQNHLYPGYVLTSVIKDLERAVYIALVSYQRQLWTDNVKQLGIAQKGVDIVIDEHNEKLITKEMREKIEQSRTEILMGTLTVQSDQVSRKESALLPSGATLAKPTTMTVVSRDENEFPYLLGTKQAFDKEKPGIAIEAMKLLGDALQIEFKFVRRPWRRCLNDLKQGQFDALVYAGFSAELEEYGKFPKRDDKVDEDRRLFTEKWMLYKRQRDSLPWQGFISRDIEPVGTILGAGIIKELQRFHVRFEEAKDLESNFRKLLLRRVRTVAATDLSGSFVLRKEANEFRDIVELQPEMAKNNYYLMFSQQFHKKYPAFAEIIWNTLSSIRESVEFWERIDSYFE